MNYRILDLVYKLHGNCSIASYLTKYNNCRHDNRISYNSAGPTF